MTAQAPVRTLRAWDRMPTCDDCGAEVSGPLHRDGPLRRCSGCNAQARLPAPPVQRAPAAPSAREAELAREVAALRAALAEAQAQAERDQASMVRAQAEAARWQDAHDIARFDASAATQDAQQAREAMRAALLREEAALAHAVGLSRALVASERDRRRDEARHQHQMRAVLIGSASE